MNNAAAQIETAAKYSNLAGWLPCASELRAMTRRKAEALIESQSAMWRKDFNDIGCEVFLDNTENVEIALSEHSELGRQMQEAGHAYSTSMILASFVLEYGEQD